MRWLQGVGDNDVKLQMKEDKIQTYYLACFMVLAYEIDSSEKKEIEKKIRRRLKYHKLGEYNQDKVDYIRQFKIDLFLEISKRNKSRYFHKSKSDSTDLADFASEKIISDYKRKYHKLSKEELKGMLNFAIYLCYLS